MTDERFSEILNGPLAHPVFTMQLGRLAIALRVVVEATGEAGEKALEEHCRAREEKDAEDIADHITRRAEQVRDLQ